MWAGSKSCRSALMNLISTLIGLYYSVWGGASLNPLYLVMRSLYRWGGERSLYRMKSRREGSCLTGIRGNRKFKWELEIYLSYIIAKKYLMNCNLLLYYLVVLTHQLYRILSKVLRLKVIIVSVVVNDLKLTFLF